MTINDGGEHVPGAAAAARGLLVRQLAWRILAAQFACDRLQNSETVIAVVEAGVTMPEVNTEAAELRRIYGLDDMAPSDGLDVICEQLRLYQLDAPEGPGPDAEHHHGSDGLPL
ncbi:hypothetical protein [Mycolicibacterium iranicum]|uniref:Uncharacterized protein n=1 Tax=Mycolicibacterium iranicum TaxID=912594 RepID=A0ABT4HQ11_MYCIR|nr:hypothetical protein [Mycolicibacterium iranicum]MCZ0732321.1 hypothetical protein [Mycolicibacterium iranicum]